MNFQKSLRNFDSFFLGSLLPLAFAPFHLTGALLIGLMLFYINLQKSKISFTKGLLFGSGFTLLGCSWIYVSIHQYGHLPLIISAFITIIFIIFLGSFYGIFSWLYTSLQKQLPFFLKPLVFASLWCCIEWMRAHLFGGFPWLIIGFSSLNSAFKNILPILGIYGASFFMVFCSAVFGETLLQKGLKRLYALIPILLLCILSYIPPQKSNLKETIDVAFIQDNVKMSDKWDPEQFWSQLYRYQYTIQKNLAPNRVIILPEAAIAAPKNYIKDVLNQVNLQALKNKTAILVGIPESHPSNNNDFFNTILALGEAKGHYLKQQLVPFGEYIPSIWVPFMNWLNIPLASTIPGSQQQKNIQVFKKPIASLICYELAYPEILRRQLPKAQWIVSASDDGWFGHSFALYQHLEMAQVLSFMSQRAQVFVNNNGLSSTINSSGEITSQLPAWKSGTQISKIFLNDTITPWIIWGDKPMMLFNSLIVLLSIMISSRQIFLNLYFKKPTIILKENS